MIFIIYLIFSSSNTSPKMARPLEQEKPAWTGFMLYEIGRAPVPPTGPSKCIPGGRLNEHAWRLSYVLSSVSHRYALACMLLYIPACYHLLA
ncbi:hypothetical protein D8674_010050 [Pyrus ussuriensis x Pyrus communis]|uniref:Uncharacterized protein n=1 Tax=Pyrus ussuriensis x Pyrus communis TaxID=2448454 RepID=A0A5N5F9M6_9ROSA|nr:hypothetical protein D8674_010050 [Pyrus ussuriensis x Pyrus communis]